MKRALLLGLLAAAGCTPSASPRMNGEEGPTQGSALEIHTELEYSTLPMDGEVGTFEVWIKNVSKQYVILRDLVQPGLGSVMHWQVPRSGALQYNVQTGAFDYEPHRASAADEQRRAYNVALLTPGEEIHLKPRIRLLRLPRRFGINYFVLDRRQLSESVYFESRTQGRIQYRRLTGEALDLALVSPHVPDKREVIKARPRVSSHRTVVYPHAETLLEPPRHEPLVLDVRLDPRPFTMQEAASRAGIAPKDLGSDHTFYANAEAWILRGEKGLVMVTQRIAQPLPEIGDPDLFFFLCDTMGGGTLAFAVRTPLEVRLGAFRMLPSRECPNCRNRLKAAVCVRCGVTTVPSDDVPRSTTGRECYTCRTRTAGLKCEKCGGATMGAEDAYPNVLHATRADLTRLLRTLADEGLRIEIMSDGQRYALAIRR